MVFLADVDEGFEEFDFRPLVKTVDAGRLGQTAEEAEFRLFLRFPRFTPERPEKHHLPVFLVIMLFLEVAQPVAGLRHLTLQVPHLSLGLV